MEILRWKIIVAGCFSLPTVISIAIGKTAVEKKFKFISSYLMCSVVWNIDNNLNWIFRLVYGCGSNYDLIKMQLINLIEL